MKSVAQANQNTFLDMMQMKRYFICLLLLFTNSCFPQESTYKIPLVEEGEVILYLQPMPQESSKLRFIIDEIAALRNDGNQIPLSLSFNELKGADLAGFQKVLASGILPRGSYTGISIRVSKAFVQSEQGEIALLVPEEPLTTEHLFEVKRREAQALFLSLNPSGTITNGIRFTPVFSMETSGRILVNLTGYVSNSDSNLISVFNKKTLQVVDAIATGRGPKGIVLDQIRTRAYVAVSGDDTIEVVDVFKGSTIGRIRLGFGDNPIELALTPDGRTLVSVNYNSNTVSIVDAISMIEVRRISVGQRPTSAVVDPSGSKAYIMNSMSNSVSVVDLTQRVITVTIRVAGTPLRGDINRTGDRLYVIRKDSPNVAVIDPSSLRVIENIFVGMGAASIKVDFRTGLVLVGKKFGGEILFIDPSSLMFIDKIRVKGNAAFMSIDREENTLFVALPDRRVLRKVNLTSKKTMAEIEVGQGAYAIVVMGES